MDTVFVYSLILVLLAALIGGTAAKLIKLPPFVGYLVAGVIAGIFYPKELGAEKLAEIGVILLLFSVGLEFSLGKLSKVLKSVTIGAFLQLFPITAISYLILYLIGIPPIICLILGAGFSISSTSILIKILSDRGEMDTLHGKFMVGWTIVEDLIVIPMIVLLPSLKEAFGLAIFLNGAKMLLVSGLIVAISVILGRVIAPLLIHRVAALNSRELLVVTSVFLALGTAAVTSFFGMSPALGAFLAGIVISESQENHEVFAETRPLRDLFMAIFFVTLGFLVNIQIVASHAILILALVVLVIVVKFLVVSLLTLALGYHGKTAIKAGLGLAQVGDLAFVFYSQASGLKLLTLEMTSVAIAVALITLIASPFLFRLAEPIWHFLRSHLSSNSFLNKLILGWDREKIEKETELENHIIICGYGRVGSWVGKALESVKIPFVVIDFDQKVVNDLKKEGKEVIYGDPTEPEVLEAAGIKKAKAIVLALPDRIAQETLVTHIQTVAPTVKIISRVHLNEDWEKMKTLRVDKIVQPEFEAAIAIVKTIFFSMGKPKEEVMERIKNLRLSKAMT